MKTSCTGLAQEGRPDCYIWIPTPSSPMPRTASSMAEPPPNKDAPSAIHIPADSPLAETSADHDPPCAQQQQVLAVDNMTLMQMIDSAAEEAYSDHAADWETTEGSSGSQDDRQACHGTTNYILRKPLGPLSVQSTVAFHLVFGKPGLFPSASRSTADNTHAPMRTSEAHIIPRGVHSLAALSRGDDCTDLFILSGRRAKRISGHAEFQLRHAMWTGTSKSNSWQLSEPFVEPWDHESALGTIRQLVVQSPDNSRIELLLPQRWSLDTEWFNSCLSWRPELGWSLAWHDSLSHTSASTATRTRVNDARIEVVKVESLILMTGTTRASAYPVIERTPGPFDGLMNMAEAFTASRAVTVRRGNVAGDIVANMAGTLVWAEDSMPHLPMENNRPGRFQQSTIVVAGLEHSIPRDSPFLALSSGPNHATLLYPGCSGGIHIWHQSSRRGPWRYKAQLVPGQFVSPDAITLAKGPIGIFHVFWVAANGQILHVRMRTKIGNSLMFNTTPDIITVPDTALRSGPIAAVRTELQGGQSKLALFFVVGTERKLSSLIWTGPMI